MASPRLRDNSASTGLASYDHTEPYDYHGGFYRAIDPSRPWLASPAPKEDPPLSPSFQLPTTATFQTSPDPFSTIRSVGSGRRSATLSPTSPTSTSQTAVTVNVPNFPTPKPGLCKRILQFVKTGSFSSSPARTFKLDIPIYAPSPAEDADDHSKVKPHEWKAYGYYARPYLNGIYCPNSPAASEKSITTSALNEIIASVRTADGVEHPERWVAGLRHPSLPTRPTRWNLPQPGEPLPFPWEVQLNPLLVHPLWGPSPLSWCLAFDPTTGNARHGRVHYDLSLCDADYAQPATWPFLTHMHFNAVSGDEAPIFPWPFTVVNERGIKVGDVLSEIYKMFQTIVMDDERSSWPLHRRQLAEKAWMDRCHALELGQRMEEAGGIRRCDSFGAMVFFRGIEPSIDGGGWMITFGTY